MSKTELIHNILIKHGDIVSVSDSFPLSRRNPTVIVPHNNKHSFTPRMKAWTYQRYNKTRVLRLEMETPEVQPIDISRLNQWVAQSTGTMPFATVRVIARSEDTALLAVTHTVLVQDVSEESMSEIMGGFMYMFDMCVDRLNLMEHLCDNNEDEEEDNDINDDEDEDDNDPVERTIDGEEVLYPRTQHMINKQARANTGEKEVFSQLAQMVGLAPVKQLVRQLAAQQQIANKRAQHGLKAVVPSPHLVFTGNPGTGKTTVARLIGQLYKSLGLLKSGHVVEADRTSLVAAYLGQTAIKTRAVCKSALGGVLFIDEAYSLAVDGRDYGQEAIEALLTFMEDHRGEFVVVVAGYADRMETFLRSNPGLRSRFDQTLYFPDYTTSELVTMFATLAKENQYVLYPGVRDALKAHINSWSRGEGFGNGREVRRLFNFIVGAHAASLAGKSDITTRQLRTITKDLIPAPLVIYPSDEILNDSDKDLIGGYL